MTFGGYTFEPVPQLTLSIEYVRDEAGALINVRHTASLEGQLVSLGKVNAGAAELLTQQDNLRESLINCSGCPRFQFSCDGTTLIDAYARVDNISFNPSNDNWVFTSNYNVNISWDALSDKVLASGTADLSCLGCLSNRNESWDIGQPESVYPYLLPGCSGSGFAQNKTIIDVTHTVSAKGYNCCIDGVEKKGWESAKEWVVNQLGYDSGILADVSGAFSFNPTDFNAYNHRRQTSINKTTGDFSVSETWTLIGGSGFPLCIEDYTVDITNDIGSRFTQVTIQGTLQGLETRDANFNVTKTKFQSAEDCWDQVKDVLYDRASCVIDSVCPLRTTPVRTSVTKNPSQGVINYSYTYDSRVQLIPNSISESISVEDVLPSMQIAQIPVIARRSGPILFDLKSNNVLTRNASINILLKEPTGCYPGSSGSGIFCGQLNASPRTQVNNLLCCLENDLETNFDIVYRVQDTESWAPIDGQYSRQVSWLYQNCSGTTPANFC